ncbi:hypothetical protein [Clostridium arbusti]|uniref:hypothetical protein n=1 Tax=Clostridium arbusti TaxID=1137848 RepID=UPI001111335A|nr:hypothetical protein [Clostridium arbusti]
MNATLAVSILSLTFPIVLVTVLIAFLTLFTVPIMPCIVFHVAKAEPIPITIALVASPCCANQSSAFLTAVNPPFASPKS